jgi:hypothetical protein
MQDEFTVRRDPIAAASFAAIFECKKSGMAMADRISTDVRPTSIWRSENPVWFLLCIISNSSLDQPRVLGSTLLLRMASMGPQFGSKDTLEIRSYLEWALELRNRN